MEAPSYFVLVFGDPGEDRDPVDSGSYVAGEGYPQFTVKPGDMLLLYCTEGYRQYPKQIPAMGVAIRAKSDLIEYRWIPFAQPILRTDIEQKFEPEDQKKMGELKFNRRRAFSILKESFARTTAGRILASEM